MFLYELSKACNELKLNGLANEIYALNKIVSSFDLFYEVVLPEIYFFDHPVGSVIGRATVSNYFSFSQNCTVGNNKGIYPVLGEKVKMHSGSSLIGNCNIGSNVIIATGVKVVDTDIPSNSIVFSDGKKLILKSTKDKKYMQEFNL